MKKINEFQGAQRGGDEVPAGTFHSVARVAAGRGGDEVPAGTFHVGVRTLVVTTTKGSKKYRLTPASKGIDIYIVESGFLKSSNRFLGHASSIENAVLLARVNAGDSIVKSTSLRDA